MEIQCSYYNPQEIGTDGYLTTQFASSTCEVHNLNIASTTNGFTYGEVINSFFLFLIFLMFIFSIITIKTTGFRDYDF